jgi:valyl-tRNA synthetase
MKKEIPKAYNPKKVEDKIYKKWKKSGYFNPDNLKLPKDAEKFSISMPPPNFYAAAERNGSFAFGTCFNARLSGLNDKI